MGRIAASRDLWAQANRILDGWLANHNFVSGEKFGIGDIPVSPFTYRWFNLPIEREELPNLKRWHDQICARPAFQRDIIDIGLQ